MKNKCVLPFISHDYQRKTPCCVLTNYKNKDDLDQLLQDHLDDKRSRYCEVCWKTEEAGIKSKRQYYNQTYSQYVQQEHRSTILSVIPVGNVCNLNCVTCHPKFSTSWFKKYQSMYPGSNYSKNNVLNDIDLDQVSNLDYLKHIEFIGGETLMSKSLWKYLRNIPADSSFSLQTNGTYKLTPYHVKTLSKFNKFNICFSLDGYGKIFEYLRQPADWGQVSDNIKQYSEALGNNNLSIYITISNLNIFYIDKIVLNLFKFLPVKIDLNPVLHDIFGYENLCPDVGAIVERNNPVFFKTKKFKWRGTADSNLSILENLRKQDAFSGRKFSDYLPEFYEVLKNKTPAKE